MVPWQGRTSASGPQICSAIHSPARPSNHHLTFLYQKLLKQTGHQWLTTKNEDCPCSSLCMHGHYLSQQTQHEKLTWRANILSFYHESKIKLNQIRFTLSQINQ